MNTPSKDFGIVILLNALGTRQRLVDDIDIFLADWDLVLTRLKENIDKLEQELSGHKYRIGIRSKDIFDNIQLFYPVDDPHTEYIDLTGSNSIWWSLQYSAGISAMRVLNNKAYVSSPRYRHFVKYRIPIKEPTRNRRKMFDRLAMVNLNRHGEIFENVDDKEIENTILQQIQLHHNNPKVKKRWENIKDFIEYVSNVSDENLFL
jgi:hypothetical protein